MKRFLAAIAFVFLVAVTAAIAQQSTQGISSAGQTTLSTLFASGAGVINPTLVGSSSNFGLVSGTLATSSTSAANVLAVQTTIQPTGASETAARGLYVNPTLTGSVSPTTFAGINTTLAEAGSSAFTGTVGTGYGLRVGTPALNSEAAMTNFNGVGIDSLTNGSGNTSGTISNDGILINTITAVAGSGGTMDNTGLEIVVPSGTNAGTMVNRGIYIHGTAASGGTITNYAIDDESTAQARFVGTILGAGTTDSSSTSTGEIQDDGGLGVAKSVWIGTTLDVVGTVRASHGYTVATLPAAGTAGRRAYVTDQLTACVAAGAALTGGGAVVCPVFDNGTAWVGD
jgi:hypothetical protein